jgi:hypothetical protein
VHTFCFRFLEAPYSYLWHAEHMRGNEEGRKDRPCAVVAALRTDEASILRALVLPITHNPPTDADSAIEIPAAIKKHLGLDDGRSWIILTEWNDFVWPGPDLRAISATKNSVAYGVLSPRFFTRLRDAFLKHVTARTAKPIKRT